MRIEKTAQTVGSTYCTELPKSQEVKAFNSTLVSAGNPSLIGRVFTYISRKISNFFRAIFSCCLPINRRASVGSDEIEYQRSRNEQADEMSYKILLNGFSTNNEIKYKKMNGILRLTEITFPDIEMREHMHALLIHMMEKEEADGVGTEYLDRAKVLWSAGFSSKDSISFDPQGVDHSNKTIKKIIEEAEKKRGSLNGHYLEILLRVEKSLTDHSASQDAVLQKFLDSVVDIASSVHIIGPRLPGVSIQITDLLSLLEIVEIGNIRGIRFANYGQGGLAVFKSTSPF